ncbi:hypothetical protein AGMMS49992_15170 [Clostridia bacterium]|nr:hypothetical protein AGMMS49992_15170 [Clostridia bacterium]
MPQHPNKKQPSYANKASRRAAAQKSRWTMPIVITAIVAIVAIAAVFTLNGGIGVGRGTASTDTGITNNIAVTDSETASSDASQTAGLVIPINEITTTATFYPVEVGGTKLEVIAVRAPDGSVRTAFNTCQVCYDSGRGYYKQVGNVLVCQNCGNRFNMSQVEVVSGGCNPVPIFPENKIVTDETITISNEFLTKSAVIFANWKAEY